MPRLTVRKLMVLEGMAPRKVWSTGTPANFHLIGHSLLAVIVGYLGGFFACHAGRSRR